MSRDVIPPIVTLAACVLVTWSASAPSGSPGRVVEENRTKIPLPLVGSSGSTMVVAWSVGNAPVTIAPARPADVDVSVTCPITSPPVAASQGMVAIRRVTSST